MSRKGFASSGRTDGFAKSAAPAAPAAFGFGAFSSDSTSSNLSYLSEAPAFSLLDPDVVISFKSLVLKKDAKTKTRALDEIISYAKAHPHDQGGGVQDAILDAWVKVYPRAAIDGDRRVRELSHILQYELMVSARKRMEKRIPKLVGTWLVGTFDKERPVAKAARDGLASFLNTDDKYALFWKKCQPQILDYATAAANETIESLCDEKDRKGSPDEARAKYLRVITGAVCLVLSLLRFVGKDDRQPQREKYETVLALEPVWKAAATEDSFLRRNVYQLLSTCIDQEPDILDGILNSIQRVFINDCIKSDQSGTATEYVRTLVKLTQWKSSVWVAAARDGKKRPWSHKQLQLLVEKGSHGDTAAFWVSLNQLLGLVPHGDLTFEQAAGFLHSMRTGVSNRFEPPANIPEAWACYIEAVKRFATSLRSAQNPEVDRFVQENLFPLTAHYLTQEKSIWSSGARIPVLLRAYDAATQSETKDILTVEWQRLADAFVSKLQPDNFQEDRRSQTVLADEGNRWFSLVGAIYQNGKNTNPVREPSMAVISACLDTVEKFDFKPFGAAAVLDSAVRKWPQLVEVIDSSKLVSVISEHISTVLSSPSATMLLSCLSFLSEITDKTTQTALTDSFPHISEAILSLDIQDTSQAETLASFLANKGIIAELIRSNGDLQNLLRKYCFGTATGTQNSWKLFETVLSFNLLTENNAGHLVRALVDHLDDETSQESILKAVEIIAKYQPEALSSEEQIHIDLVTKLLGLANLSGSRVQSIQSMMDQRHTATPDGKPPAVRIVQGNLSDAGPQVLDVETLVEQAISAARSKAVPVVDLLPSLQTWMQELSMYFSDRPSPLLSLSNGLGGAHFLIAQGPPNPATKPKRGSNGSSIPARMAYYVSRVLGEGLSLSELEPQMQVDVMYFLALSVQLATDQITLMSEGQLWETLETAEALAQAEDFVAAARKIINGVATDSKGWVDGSLFDELVKVLIEESKQLTPGGLYTARALSELFQSFASTHGFPSSIESRLQPTMQSLFKSEPEALLGASAILSGFGDLLSASKPVINFCNRLVSEVLGAKPGEQKTLLNLILLTACASVFENTQLPVAQNRLVFACKDIINWFAEPEDLDHALAAEVCRVLQRLLPSMSGVYGSYWEDTLNFCVYLWQRAEGDPVDTRLSYVHAALRLESTLQLVEDPNDDLLDALKGTEKERALAILDLLKLDRGPENQAQAVVEGLICRRVEKMPLTHIKDVSEVYPLMAAESRDVQTAAFNILHRVLPSQQPDISVQVVLDKKNAQLPEELLSLLLEPPTLEKYPDDVLALFPLSIRSYLLTWHLIFDAFTTASHKVRADYTEHLKTCGVAAPLLDFIFDVLGHSAGHALKLERAGLDESHILAYNLRAADAEPDEKNMHWLMLHVLYQLLSYAPGLFKTWHINAHKLTKRSVSEWTARYLSPMLVRQALRDVAEWAEKQEPAGEESELKVRVNPKSREVQAGYEVDDMECVISIRLAEDWPLGGVTMGEGKRVVADERKWKAWMRATQGVIVFSNGNIIDGLTVFKRNLVGALKGHTECSICFSIISEDHRTPEKRCGTCKNMFHKYCLYRWMHSSSQNTCPLCRTPID